MSFLAPLFLLGALAAAVPILLHMLRRESAPAFNFSAVRFLRHAPREQRRRRHIRDIPLLLLRVLALLLLAFAFARPYLQADAVVPTPITVVAVDTSFSMAAPGRFEAARRAALGLIGAVPIGQRVAVMAFDDRAWTVTEPSFDRGAARAAVNELTPGSGGTDYAAVLGAAGRLFAGDRGRVAVVTDLQRSGWRRTGSLPSSVTLEVVDVGGPLENLSVSTVRREGTGVAASITNHGARTRPATARLLVNQQAAGTASVTLTPGASSTVRFNATLPATGALAVQVDDQGGLPADNVRYLVLDPPPKAGVLILDHDDRGDDSFYLEQAIASVDEARGFQVTVLRGADRAKADAALLARHQVVCLLGTRGLDRATRDTIARYLRDGGALFLPLGATVDASVVAAWTEGSSGLRIETGEGAVFPTLLAPVDGRHPIFAPFGVLVTNLGRAEFTRALRVTTGSGARILARFTNGLPALVEQPVSKGRLMLFASDVSNEWNDFPRQPTFVPFVLETLSYLTGGRAPAQELLVSDVAAPAGARPGVIDWGTPPRKVAVNVEARESAPARIAPDDFTASVEQTTPEVRPGAEQAREREGAQHWWRYGVIVLLGVLLIEGVVARRPARAAAPANVEASAAGQSADA